MVVIATEGNNFLSVVVLITLYLKLKLDGGQIITPNKLENLIGKYQRDINRK